MTMMQSITSQMHISPRRAALVLACCVLKLNAQDVFLKATVRMYEKEEMPPPERPQPPAPSSNASNTWPPHCEDSNPDGWPVFQNPDDLQNDPWGKYFQEVYGGIPQSGYPICISSFHFLVDYAVANAGIVVHPSRSCPTKAGDYFKTMAPDNIQSPGASWIWNPNGFSALPESTWVEIIHKGFFADIGAAWMYYAPGSAVWFWLGNTAVYQDHGDAVRNLLHRRCFDPFHQCLTQLPAAFSKAAEDGYDSVQFLAHYDQACGLPKHHGPFGTEAVEAESSPLGVGMPGTKLGAIEIVDPKGTGHRGCASNYRAGWEASQDCNCDGSKDFANCVGFGDQS